MSRKKTFSWDTYLKCFIFFSDKGGDSIGLDRLNLSGTEAEMSETSSSIETALDSDMATRQG